MEEVTFGLTEMAWNGVTLVLARLELLGMEEIGFGLTGMAWNIGSRF
jgi:hypothetical protein